MPAAETTATFAGIHNENEFYSHHYLSEVFAGDIREIVERWRDAAASDSPTTIGRTPLQRDAAARGPPPRDLERCPHPPHLRPGAPAALGAGALLQPTAADRARQVDPPPAVALRLRRDPRPPRGRHPEGHRRPAPPRMPAAAGGRRPEPARPPGRQQPQARLRRLRGSEVRAPRIHRANRQRGNPLPARGTQGPALPPPRRRARRTARPRRTTPETGTGPDMPTGSSRSIGMRSTTSRSCMASPEPPPPSRRGCRPCTSERCSRCSGSSPHTRSVSAT